MIDSGKMHPRREGLKPAAFGAPILAGALLILAFPPFEQGYLAWFALTPLLWFCLKAPPRQALLGGLLFGLPLHLYLNLYLSGVLLNYLSVPLAVFAMVLLVLFLSTFNALFALTASVWIRGRISSLTVIFVLPALWLLMEFTRSISFIGYNVGYLGYTQWSYPLILNMASVYGYWGLPFIMIAFQTLIILSIFRLAKMKFLYISAASVAALMLLGISLPSLFPVEKEETPLWTALIQGNSTTEEILSRQGKETIFNRYLEMTRQAAEAQPQLQLVVWPETVVDLFVSDTMLHRPKMEALAEELGLNILYGARVRDEENLFNSVVLLSPGEGKAQYYHKQRLVPIVEYFPLQEQLNEMLDLDLLLGSYTVGERQTIFDINGIPVAAVVCFESYFGSYTRHFSDEGGRHLFVLTNDAWFGNSIGLEQHAQVAAIRAAEMGTGVTQVANSGITASYDYKGREIFRSGKSEPDIFLLPLEMERRQTFYTLAGDYFPAFWLIFLVVNFISGVIKKRRHRLQTLKPFD